MNQAPQLDLQDVDWAKIPAGTQLHDAIYIGDLEDGSPEWHAQRANVLGGSDIASVCNIPGRFKSPYILGLEKAGYKQPDEVGPELQELFDWGHALEPVIIEKFTEMTDIQVARTGTWVNKDRPWHGINCDGLLLDRDGTPMGILECKYSTMGFGYENDMPPAKYVAQLRYYLAGFGFTFGYLAAFCKGKLMVYMVPASMTEKVINLRTGATEYFGTDASIMLPMAQDFVDTLARGELPPLTGSDDELDWKLSRNPEINGKDVVVPFELATEWAKARQAKKDGEAAEKLAKAKLLEVMGQAKAAKAGYDVGKKKAKTIAMRSSGKGGSVILKGVGAIHYPEPYELEIEDLPEPEGPVADATAPEEVATPVAA